MAAVPIGTYLREELVGDRFGVLRADLADGQGALEIQPKWHVVRF